ncbi:thiamine pyrophosphate enzyme [Apiospora hydei]|uniref:Thiamine pyrophosphate enzyme n=1 Tax=Apiospora hydei TaxID=1337664 RepID=A0ABR1VWA3_9PEZI
MAGLQVANHLKDREYTTAFAFFEALWEAGVTACFVNVGSDHPPLLEAIVKGKRERPDSWPRMITCPSEITAISMADGYARISGRPQAVLVHVDVGTQALGQGIHNASVGRVPVFIFAGLCPYTESGELPGSRAEYMHWLQEAPDQKAIVRQYCRYTGEVRTGLNIKKTVGRALQFANSTPRGPVYVAVAREVLAEEIPPQAPLNQKQWGPIGPSALPVDAVHEIAAVLIHAQRPLVITGYSGRDRRTPKLLVALADLIPGIRVHDTGGSNMCFPFSHPSSEGFRLSSDECTRDADVIFILDCDVPWIPSRNPPPKNAKIYHVDCDPLNQAMPVSFSPADGWWKADSYTALKQLVTYIQSDSSLLETLRNPKYAARGAAQAGTHKARLAQIAASPQLEEEALDIHSVGNLLKTLLPDSTTFVVEAVTASHIMSDQIQPSRPGSWVNCGGTGIGWSNGATMGVKMALEDQERDHEKGQSSLVCQIVGDGSFMCAAPSSALWVASKYEIPVLTILLNNGWKAPRNSTQLVYPNGLNTSATDDEINVSFRPTPNYAALAEAAAGSEVGRGNAPENTGSWMKGRTVRTVSEFREALKQANTWVDKDGKGMLIEVMM